MKNKIYNGFMFFNEFDMLDIRLNELWNDVDVFILVESSKTHRNGNKPLYFEERKKEYEQYKEKLRHVVIDLEFDSNPWVLENAHRRAIMKGLDDATPNDYLIITDADEIPRASAIRNYKGKGAVLSMGFFYYQFNLRNKHNWHLAKMIRLGDMDRDINEYRKDTPGLDVIPNAGWHFSKVYSMDQIKFMFRECLADDLFHDEIINNLERMAAEGITDWCNHKNKFDRVEIDDTYPEFFRANIDRFKKFIV